MEMMRYKVRQLLALRLPRTLLVALEIRIAVIPRGRRRPSQRVHKLAGSRRQWNSDQFFRHLPGPNSATCSSPGGLLWPPPLRLPLLVLAVRALQLFLLTVSGDGQVET
jgi:hypothetical protein